MIQRKMIRNSNRIVEGRWICTQCNYKSHYQKVPMSYFRHKVRFCPKKGCTASRVLEYEIKKR